MQPNLSVHDVEQPEQPLRLMYAIHNPTNEPRRLTKIEVEDILRFLSQAIYGDCFGHRADFDQKYRKYLEGWFNDLRDKVPEVVALI